jgi:hypothetical protein
MLLLAAGALLLLPSLAAPRMAPALKLPLRVKVTAVGDQPVAYRAYTAGGRLLVIVMRENRVVGAGMLPAADTARGSSPAEFQADISTGDVVFAADGPGQLQVEVWPNGGATEPKVIRTGRHLTVRQAGSFAGILAR